MMSTTKYPLLKGNTVNVYVYPTDGDWYNYLRARNLPEVNFWKPSGKPFKALRRDELLLFKLKAPWGGRIAGGGFFVDAPITSIDWAWRAFGEENGVSSLMELNNKIWHYKGDDNRFDTNASITSIILTDTFYLDESCWIDISEHWSSSIVQGKAFHGEEAARLLKLIQERLENGSAYLDDSQGTPPSINGGTILTAAKHRIGQGAFRTFVSKAYQKRCAITGERTVPVLQAAHIQSFSSEGPNSVDNGIFLRSDMHALFDSGYITLEYDLQSEPCVVVSRRLHDDYGNGKDYYPYHGRRLAVVPERSNLRPAKQYLDWHHENVFLG